MNLINIYNAKLAEYPDEIAIICEDRKCSYSDLDSKSRQYAAALQSLGIREGDRVGLLMNNSLDIIFAFFACFRIKAIAVPMRPNSPAEEIIFPTNHCKIKLFLIDFELTGEMIEVQQNCPALEQIFVVGGSSVNNLRFPHLQNMLEAETGTLLPELDTASETPAVIFYTSGTTAKPKGVTHTHGSLKNAAVNRCCSLNHTDESSFLTSSFLCHASAMTIILLPMLQCGGTALFMQQFNLEKFADLIYNTPVTNVVASPNQWRDVIDQGLLNRPTEQLQYATSGGNTVPLKLRQDFLASTGVPLTSGLGMTECGGYMAAFDRNHPVEALGSPVSNTEIRLINTRGSDIQQGEIGELIVKTNSMMCGYWNDKENTEKAFFGEWFHTGDLARQDSEGFYYFSGRVKHTIIVGTSNVAPGEVEDILNAHPKIKQAVVVPVPDPVTIQAIFAFIQLKECSDAISESELAKFAATHLQSHKIPKYWHFTETLEVSGILEKIDRNILIKQAEELIYRL